MKRRQLLRTTGALVIGTTGAGVAAAGDGDADPRPAPQGGTQPNENVPTVVTGPFQSGPYGDDQSKIPVGHWITHDSHWVTKDLEGLKQFLDDTYQTFTIDGEVFVLDEADDWEPATPSGDWEAALKFEYTTPPKKKGKTYECRWNFESGGEYFYDDITPIWNPIEIVGRNGQ
jgi:hypothetical protein